MGSRRYVPRRRFVVFCAFAVSAILLLQLSAATAWTADSANRGPTIVILQLSNDKDSDWAVADLQQRLSTFIVDDPYLVDRVVVRKTSDPYVAMDLYQNIVIYVSHGGPFGIVTGRRLTSWKTMADIVTLSTARMHLFAACYSRNMIRFGDEESGKKLYTVPGARPAEVTNVEIVSTVMLALGLDAEEVEVYRTEELTQAKKLLERGSTGHIMDFEQIILSEIETIDASYSDTYTSSYRVIRDSTETILSGDAGFIDLPSDLQDMLAQYYRNVWYRGVEPGVRDLEELAIIYTMNYYYEAWWVEDPEPPPPPDDPWEPPDEPGGPIDPGDPSIFSVQYLQAAAETGGHWEYGEHTFTGGTYSGVVKYAGDRSMWPLIEVNVTASGSELDASGRTLLDSIALSQFGDGGIYVQKQKVDGVWQEPVVGRNPYRTGGLWTDPCVKVDYERDDSWPFGAPIAGGSLYTSGEYLYTSGIDAGPDGWRGTSFVRTLPSYFELRDLGSFSANMSMLHARDGMRMGTTYVVLFDENKKASTSLLIADSSTSQLVYMEAKYIQEDGSYNTVVSQQFSGDFNGVVQIRYDPLQGLFGDVPNKGEELLYTYPQINGGRLIKYIAIQSSRYGSYPQHDDRIYNIRLSYAGSEYTVFHDNCNDADEFYEDAEFPYGATAPGVLFSPTGQSYLTWDSIPTGTGWHGPNYVHALDRPFRLYQLSEFSVTGEIVQSSYTMGCTNVALFDENKQIVMLVSWADSWLSSTKGYFCVYFYPQNGGSYSQSSGYITTSFSRTGRLWWKADGGQGNIGHSINQRSTLDTWPVDNASRVIKYVLTMGWRWESRAMVDMRIHDINVEADLSRLEPEDPVPYDGSGFLSASDEAQTNRSLEPLALSIESSWQLIDFWPWLNLRTVDTTAEVLGLEIMVDILGNVIVNNLQMHIPLVDAMTQEEIDQLAGVIIDNFMLLIVGFAFPFVLALALAFGWRAIENMSWDPIKMVVGLAIWLGLFLSYIAYMTWLVSEGALHPFGVAFAYLSLVVVLVITLWDNILECCQLLSKIRQHGLSSLLEVQEFPWHLRIREAMWSTVIAFIKVFVLVVLLYNFALLIGMGLTM